MSSRPPVRNEIKTQLRMALIMPYSIIPHHANGYYRSLFSFTSLFFLHKRLWLWCLAPCRQLIFSIQTPYFATIKVLNFAKACRCQITLPPPHPSLIKKVKEQCLCCLFIVAVQRLLSSSNCGAVVLKETDRDKTDRQDDRREEPVLSF